MGFIDGFLTGFIDEFSTGVIDGFPTAFIDEFLTEVVFYGFFTVLLLTDFQRYF